MAREFILGQIDEYTQEVLAKTNRMDLVSLYVQMEVGMKVRGSIIIRKE